MRAIVITAIVVSLWSCAVLNADAAERVETPLSTVRLRDQGKMPAIVTTAEWLNSTPLAPAELRGKVVLVDFWTYTCINWLRTLPYVRAWSEKYRNHGLVVIGVHSPEFEFERDIDNVRRAVTDMHISYPVAIDSNHATWRAFNNNYWPALYFADAQGRIRHTYFGEGDYEKAERVIQQLLIESGAKNVATDLVVVNGQGAEAAADWRNLQSPENYFGYERTEKFASTEDATLNARRAYTLPVRLRLNHWAVAGDWTMMRHAMVINKSHGRMQYRFHARDLHLVMGPSNAGSRIRFRVLIDGLPPAADHGSDVDADGNGIATEQRLYQLIRQTSPIKERQFQIEFLDAGMELFAATFG
jgi:thiol-disulfide isomerase/thioredoxin